MKHTAQTIATLGILAALTANAAQAQQKTPPAATAASAETGVYQIVQAPEGKDPHKGGPAQIYQQAISDFKAGRLANAEAELMTVEQKAPTDPTAHSILGYIYLKENKGTQALAEMQTVIRLAPTDTAARKNLGRAYLQLGDNAKAITQFQKVLAAAPTDTDARYGLALALGQSGRNDEAAEAFQKVIAARPTSSAYQNLAVVLQKGGHSGQAADAFAQASALDPQNAIAPLNAGLLYAQTGNNDKAIPALTQALALGTDYKYEAHMALGQALAKTDPDKAIAQFAAAAQARPTEVPPVYNQAVLQAQAGHRPEAEAAYRKVIDLAPTDPKTLSEAQTNLGLLLAQDGNATQAIPLLTQVAQASPTDPAPHLALANLYGKLGNPQKAVDERMAALALTPDDVQTRLLVADSLLAQKKYALSAAQYDAAAQRQPGSAAIQNARGTAHEQAGDLTTAEAAFRAALAANPQYAQAENNLGVIYEKQGHRAQAIAAYKKAAQIDPTLAVARRNIARFTAK